MNRSSEAITTSTRVHQKQEPYSRNPLSAMDESESSMVQNIFKKSVSEEIEQSDNDDLYKPLSYEEADEDKLAEFFYTLDVDVSFEGCNGVINNMSEISTNTDKHSTKRRRLSNSAGSFSSSFSDDSEDYDGMQRKQNRSGRHSVPVE